MKIFNKLTAVLNSHISTQTQTNIKTSVLLLTLHIHGLPYLWPTLLQPIITICFEHIPSDVKNISVSINSLKHKIIKLNFIKRSQIYSTCSLKQNLLIEWTTSLLHRNKYHLTLFIKVHNLIHELNIHFNSKSIPCEFEGVHTGFKIKMCTFVFVA